MNALDRAMLHFREATYHYNKASKILLEIAEAERERLRGILNNDRQATQTSQASDIKAGLENSQGTQFNVTDRAKIIDLELRRIRARNGIPQDLSDII